MFFKSLLLLSFLFTFASREISIENKCDHDVWIKRHLANSTSRDIHVRVGSTYRYEAEDDGKWCEVLTVDTGCKNESTDCDTGEDKPRRLANKNCFLAPLVTTIGLHTILLRNNNSKDIPVDAYGVFIENGYSVPIEVSVDSKDYCESILCNMTLDECPHEERNGAGDLRIQENGRTVGCMAPCVTETLNGTCECTTKEDTKYHALIDRKCPSKHNTDNFNWRKVIHGCNSVESMRIVTCP